ncbi:class III signal peptide-containing protein [Methanothermococcus sp. SCGC AD-155-C09]|nr:class III signal peptide-containing protein [Methanothermococcus sp. SCGC AD-155-C09]
MIMEKLMSKKGQISMEIGILVAAAVAVAAIAAYYYTTSVKESAEDAGNKADDTINTLETATDTYRTGMETELTLESSGED